jgi:hypothetical protein
MKYKTSTINNTQKSPNKNASIKTPEIYCRVIVITKGTKPNTFN